MATRRAVIDIGTNSVKLLVADIDQHHVTPVWEGSKQTRLGRGFYQNNYLQQQAIDDTARAVVEFRGIARERQAATIRVIATSAARDALNSDDLIRAVECAADLKTEILSGQQEAALVFEGVTTDPRFGAEALLLLDVGGGSTEFILGQADHQHFRQSYPLGSVRLMEQLPHSNPPRPDELRACRQWVNRFLEKEVRPALESALGLQKTQQSNPLKESAQLADSRYSEFLLVGAGGTAAILARIEAGLETYDRARIEAVRLSRARVQWHVENLWGRSLELRKHIIGLPGSRADVILTGAVIFEAVMDQLNFSELRVSTRGLRFAAVLGPIATGRADSPSPCGRGPG